MERMLCEAETPVVHTYRYDGDKLLSLDGAECIYDNMGCPTVYLGKALAWNESGKLTSFAIDADTTATFAYDIMGKRISKQVGAAAAITFTYDGNGNLLSQSNGVKFLYDHAGIMGMTYGGNTYLYRKNIQGDVTALLNAEGKVIATYKYDAWGNHTVKVEEALDSGNFWQYNEVANLNPIRYRSYYYDTETGLYYLPARYYDPVACRFISRDDHSYLDPETVNGLNLFAYCGNDPVNKYDPTGHFLISTAVLIGAIVGAVIGATAGGIVAYNVAKDSGAEGWELFGWTVTGILGGGVIGAAIGAAVGYGVGYLAGGTYASGLSAKAVSGGVKSFLSQANKVHHVLGQAKHKLAGYTAKTIGKLMKKTLAKGVVSAYNSAKAAYWAVTGSEVTFVIIDGVIKISDMWIR